MMLPVLLLLLLSVGANAEVSWTFTTTQGSGVTLEIGVGTPATTVSLYAFVDSQDHYETDLLIPDPSIGGAYDYTQSSSFVFVSTLFDYDGVTPIGVYGKETFTIGEKTVESKPFAVRNDSIFQESYGNGTGAIGFGMPTFPNDFGNFDDYFGSWGVEVTDVSTGVYTWDHDGQVLFSLDSPYFFFGETIYKPLLESMGSIGWETFCDHCYSLPNTVLRGKCLMYDFGNEQLGITDQL
ncbi:hypothetical protein M3Y99_00468200 [Aphelenchoides fujianensis]|nr:hypothetical protein M3Y99_00468200 [Aphelenchoides fujianensis]